jgi:hypothetical protein
MAAHKVVAEQLTITGAHTSTCSLRPHLPNKLTMQQPGVALR